MGGECGSVPTSILSRRTECVIFDFTSVLAISVLVLPPISPILGDSLLPCSRSVLGLAVICLTLKTCCLVYDQGLQSCLWAAEH